MSAKAFTISPEEALQKLKDGNRRYVETAAVQGDISGAARLRTAQNGQTPYAVVIACGDSRVMPEVVFSAGIGDLFVLRVAGNIIHHTQIGSIEYACAHLGVPLVVVMGHTNCGAIAAAMQGGNDGYIKYLTYQIEKAMRGLGPDIPLDSDEACRRNVEFGVHTVSESIPGWAHVPSPQPLVVGAIYNIETGKVDFLQEP